MINTFTSANIVQGERKRKFICSFPPTRYESVGCDDGNFSSPKEYDEVIISLYSAAKPINPSAIYHCS